ncbi:velvet factor-domain-containing protein, partial [Chytriomyces sp. MP71]
MCGFGEKVDRRPVDPPPIIQLDITSNGTPEDFAYLYNPYYFMYASLIALDNEDEVHILHDGKTRSTTGSIVSSLYRLRDLDNKDGAFFVFPDLSVRMEGSYRLKFSLFEIINTEMYYCTSIISNPFNVYSAKKFPGMEESTFLSKAFAEQGLKIRIRKELRVRKEGGFVNVAPLSDFAANEQPRQKRSSIEGNQDGNDHDDSAGSASEEHITKRVKERLSSTEANSNKLAIGILGQAVPGYPYLAPAAQPPMLMVPTHYQQQQAQQMARQQAQQHAKHQAHQAQQQVHIQSQQQAQHQAQKVQQQQQQHQHHHQHTPKQQQHTEQ